MQIYVGFHPPRLRKLLNLKQVIKMMETLHLCLFDLLVCDDVYWSLLIVSHRSNVSICSFFPPSLCWSLNRNLSHVLHDLFIKSVSSELCPIFFLSIIIFTILIFFQLSLFFYISNSCGLRCTLCCVCYWPTGWASRMALGGTGTRVKPRCDFVFSCSW